VSTLLESVLLADIKRPDSTGSLLVLLLLLYFPFFFRSMLCLFLIFLFGFVFTSFVSHVCASVLELAYAGHSESLCALISGQSRGSITKYNSPVFLGQEKTQAVTGVRRGWQSGWDANRILADLG
jgi:hypothetical protein